MSGGRYISAREAAALLTTRAAPLYSYVSRGLVRSDEAPGDPRRRLYHAADIEGLVRQKQRGRKPGKVAEAALDWGLPVLDSRITLIEGGRLFYRGQDAARLAETASLETTARLLWDCGAADPFAAPMPAMPPSWATLT